MNRHFTDSLCIFTCFHLSNLLLLSSVEMAYLHWTQEGSKILLPFYFQHFHVDDIFKMLLPKIQFAFHRNALFGDFPYFLISPILPNIKKYFHFFQHFHLEDTFKIAFAVFVYFSQKWFTPRSMWQTQFTYTQHLQKNQSLKLKNYYVICTYTSVEVV